MTFDEYWSETKPDYLGDLYVYAISPDIYGDLNVNEEVWEASRQHMTTRDI